MINLIIIFLIGAFGSLILQRDDRLANIWSNSLAIIGALWGLIFSITNFLYRTNSTFIIGKNTLPILSLSLKIDQLSTFFIFIISLITLFSSIYALDYVKHYFKKYNIGALGFFFHLFIVGMLLVVTASNGIFFLIAWEIMSVASYFLVIYDRNELKNVQAGFTYLVMTHVGTVFIIIAFLIMYRFTGSFDFGAIKSGSLSIPQLMKNVIFILALIGFGTKAGIVPFHIWLPVAHPAAPSHVSALMSGVMIKTGIYMMIRIFLDLMQPVPVWWGLLILIIGSISSLLGVLFALTEHDIKKLLAYHSIENIGIILLGLGSSLTFTSLNMPGLALLSLTASLFHTLNHATFKSLLFMGAGAVINETHTRNMEEYGGLIRYMPQTALFFLVGSMAISALPPFNGFFSEWLTYQALFQGIFTLDSTIKWIFIFATGSLAFTGGLALACFVKAFGATFLARSRSEEKHQIKEAPLSLRIGMGGLALLTLILGIFSGKIITFAQKNVHLSSSVSAPNFFVSFLVIILAVILIARYLINKNQKEIVSGTWDCGTTLGPRMEITATGFARSIILIFKGILKPTIQHDIEYHDSENRYLPKSKLVTLKVQDIHHSYFYQPLKQIINIISFKIKRTQSGITNAYILYIFIALIVALFFIL